LELVITDDLQEFQRVAFELKYALHQHVQNLRRATAETTQHLMRHRVSTAKLLSSSDRHHYQIGFDDSLRNHAS
jgi:uncharacterized protein YggL (DUF469 family)